MMVMSMTITFYVVVIYCSQLLLGFVSHIVQSAHGAGDYVYVHSFWC